MTASKDYQPINVVMASASNRTNKVRPTQFLIGTWWVLVAPVQWPDSGLRPHTSYDTEGSEWKCDAVQIRTERHSRVILSFSHDRLNPTQGVPWNGRSLQ